MARLRVGLFTYGMDSELTGIGRYAVELSYALRRLDLPVDIILLSPYPSSSLKWYRDFPVYPLPTLRHLPAVLVRGHSALSHAARKMDLDILHDPCGIAPFLAKSRGVTRLVTIHDAIPLVHPEFQPIATRVVFHTLLQWARWSADAVITVSEHAKKDLVRTLGVPSQRVFVTRPGTVLPPVEQLVQAQRRLPLTLAQYGISNPYFLWVGANSPRKNLGRVLAAFALLRLRQPEARLVLTGPKPGASVTLPAGVHHLGYVNQEHLDFLYLGAQALVYPSLYEGFGFPILEAMSYGTPVITSHSSSMPEVGGNAVLCVDPYSVDQIADAMITCLDADLRQSLGLAGRLRAMQFRWDSTAMETFRIYRTFGRRQRTAISVQSGGVPL